MKPVIDGWVNGWMNGQRSEDALIGIGPSFGHAAAMAR